MPLNAAVKLPPIRPTRNPARGGARGAMLDQLTVRTVTKPLPSNAPTAANKTDPKVVASLSKLAANGKDTTDIARTTETRERRQYNETMRERGQERSAKSSLGREILALLDKIKDGVFRLGNVAGGGLFGGAGGIDIDLPGRRRSNRTRRGGSPRLRDKTSGRYLARGGAAGAALNVASTVAETAAPVAKGAGKLGKFARLGGSVLGKIALPIAAAFAIADAVQGIQNSDALLGKKSTNMDKIGVGITEAINGALFGLPDMISKQIFGQGFTRGVNDLINGVGLDSKNMIAQHLNSAQNLFKEGAAGSLALFAKASEGIMGWFSGINTRVQAIISAVKSGDWGQVAGLVADIVKYSPMGMAVTAGQNLGRAAVAAAPVVAEKAIGVAQDAGRAVVGAGAAVASWFGLGSTSKKYESGNSGAATISSGKGDPGGVSYGTYQLASARKGGKASTLDRFLQSSSYGKQFAGMEPNSKEFKDKWRSLGRSDPKFAEAQHDFIKRTHYDPAAKYAASLGFDVNDRGIADAIWSASVQHSGVRTILKRAAQTPGWSQLDNKGKIKRLYEVRATYAKNALARDPRASADTIRSVDDRYKREVKDALALSGTPVSPTGNSRPVGTSMAATTAAAQATVPTQMLPIGSTLSTPTKPTLVASVPATPPTQMLPTSKTQTVNGVTSTTVTAPPSAPATPMMTAAASAPVDATVMQNVTGQAAPTMQAPTARAAPRGRAAVDTAVLMPVLKPVVAPPAPAPVVIQQAAAPAPTAQAAPATSIKTPTVSSGGALPALDSIPITPSLELLAVASLAFHPA